MPSPSNPADGPSRLRLVPQEENLFAERVPAPVYSAVLDLVLQGALAFESIRWAQQIKIGSTCGELFAQLVPTPAIPSGCFPTAF